MEITIPQAVNVLEQALNVATTKGTFNLKDASLIDASLNALKAFLKPHFPEPEPEPEIETVETEDVN